MVGSMPGAESSSDKEMPIFRALSFVDRLRVSRCLVRGQAPADPQLATAAVELAEGYQRQSRAYAGLMRWAPMIMVVCFALLAISGAVEGNELRLLSSGMGVVWGVWILTFNPVARPKKTAQSLEASRRIAASSPSPQRHRDAPGN